MAVTALLAVEQYVLVTTMGSYSAWTAFRLLCSNLYVLALSYWGLNTVRGLLLSQNIILEINLVHKHCIGGNFYFSFVGF